MGEITEALDEAVTLYFKKKEDSHVLVLAERIRSNDPKMPDSRIGEIYRYAVLSAFRQAKEAKSREDERDFYALGLT